MAEFMLIMRGGEQPTWNDTQMANHMKDWAAWMGN